MRRAIAPAALLLLLAACASDPPLSASERAALGSPGGAGAQLGANPLGNAAGAGGRGGAGALSAQQAKQQLASVGDRVFFMVDRSDLTPEGQDVLRRQAQFLRQYANLGVLIEGHADERGTREYNLALGERRATVVKNFLVASGVPADRLRTVSYGKEKPEVVGSTDLAWNKNRRAVTTID